MQWWKNLKSKFVFWIATKGIFWAFSSLSSRRLGIRLRDYLDSKFDPEKIDTMQKELGNFLIETGQDVKS